MREIEQILPLLKEYLKNTTVSPSLKEAMLYSLEAGGKRLRPQLMLATLKGFQKPITEDALKVAGSLEMVHTYSLIHDDLPAMDNDDFRRGKLTNHKVYGEAMAILAGDGLLTGAFELLGSTKFSPEITVALLKLLGKKAGNGGMVSGQAFDLSGEKQQLALPQLQQIHLLKTGALLEYAFMAGGIMAKKSPEVIQLLEEIGYHYGLAFQIKDDLLDVEGTLEELGKNPHQDDLLEKSTYPKLLGVAGAKTALAKEITTAKEKILQLEKEYGFAGAEIIATFEKLQGK